MNFSKLACFAGASAMLLVGEIYIVSGSQGDEPESARVMMTTTSSSQNFSASTNLAITLADALEPEGVKAERPGFDLFGRSGLVVFRGKFELL